MSTAAESSAGFITGGMREPIPDSERLLPKPKGVSHGSIYRDRNGRLWSLERRPSGKKWWSSLTLVTESAHQSQAERHRKIRRLAPYVGFAGLVFMIGSLFLPVPPLEAAPLWSELVWPLAFHISLVIAPVIVMFVMEARRAAAEAWFDGKITLSQLERISGKNGDQLLGPSVDGETAP